MERLARLAHRVVWLNPLKGSDAYEPLARGMAAALPHIDVFRAGHNLQSLEEVAEVIQQRGSPAGAQAGEVVGRVDVLGRVAAHLDQLHRARRARRSAPARRESPRCAATSGQTARASTTGCDARPP